MILNITSLSFPASLLFFDLFVCIVDDLITWHLIRTTNIVIDQLLAPESEPASAERAASKPIRVEPAPELVVEVAVSVPSSPSKTAVEGWTPHVNFFLLFLLFRRLF